MWNDSGRRDPAASGVAPSMPVLWKAIFRAPPCACFLAERGLPPRLAFPRGDRGGFLAEFLYAPFVKSLRCLIAPPTCCPVVLVCPLGGAPYPPISPELTPCIIFGLPAGGNICCCCPPCIIWEPIIMGCGGCTCPPAPIRLCCIIDICCMLLRRSPIAGRGRPAPAIALCPAAPKGLSALFPLPFPSL